MALRSVSIVLSMAASAFLNEFSHFLVQGAYVMFRLDKLLLLIIFWGNMGLQLILWSFKVWMLETCKGFSDIPWHQKVNCNFFGNPTEWQGHHICFPLNLLIFQTSVLIFPLNALHVAALDTAHQSCTLQEKTEWDGCGSRGEFVLHVPMF